MIKLAVETLAYTTETMVFLFLGIGVFTFNHKYEMMGVGTLVFALINFNLARWLNISIVSYLANKSRSKKSQITQKQKFVMWIAGLRGAMAYALAMESSQSIVFTNPVTGKYSGDVMLVVTVIYSLFTILGISSFLHPIMTKCEVTKAAARARRIEESKQAGRSEDEMELIQQIEKKELSKNKCRQMKAWFRTFDRRYFSPLFIKDEDKLLIRERGTERHVQLVKEKQGREQELFLDKVEEEKSENEQE